MAETKEIKRKTVTSTAVKNRYNNKTYQRYVLTLRKDNDTDIAIIKDIETMINNGLSASDAIKSLIKSNYEL